MTDRAELLNKIISTCNIHLEDAYESGSKYEIGDDELIAIWQAAQASMQANGEQLQADKARLLEALEKITRTEYVFGIGMVHIAREAISSTQSSEQWLNTKIAEHLRKVAVMYEEAERLAVTENPAKALREMADKLEAT